MYRIRSSRAAGGRIAGLVACAVAALSLLGCHDTPPVAGSTPNTGLIKGSVPANASLASGRAIYNFRCYFCHGYSGDAQTLAATYLVPPPVNFKTASPETLTLDRIRKSVADGRPGTAMKGFSSLLSPTELDQVAAFVFAEFVRDKRNNTRYHTPENGWPDHERYVDAFPFAQGEIPLTRPDAELSASALRGRRLYLEGCVTCHDRGKPAEDPIIWEPRAVSYPRLNYDHRNPAVDASTSATPYRLHDIPPQLDTTDPVVREGERLFQENCAFCHGADGTGKNWIGAFLEPHPRDLTDPAFMKTMTRPRLRDRILAGVPGSSMPAWKAVLDTHQVNAVVSYIDAAMYPLSHSPER